MDSDWTLTDVITSHRKLSEDDQSGAQLSMYKLLTLNAEEKKNIIALAEINACIQLGLCYGTM